MQLNNQLEWDRFHLGTAKYYSTKSKDPSTKVGAVIVGPDNKPHGLGFNGFPKGVLDLPERYANRELKYKLVVHAEQNAIINAGHRAEGCTIYIWPTLFYPSICYECAKLAIQAGIKCVKYEANPNIEEWRQKETGDISKMLLNEAGIKYEQIL